MAKSPNDQLLRKLYLSVQGRPRVSNSWTACCNRRDLWPWQIVTRDAQSRWDALATIRRSRRMDARGETKETTMTTLTTSRSAARIPAVVATAGFLAIAAFQFALALGAPLGHAAWGGTYTELPPALRIASAFAAGVWVFAAWIILGRAGLRVVSLPQTFVRRGTWTLVGVNLFAALVNIASSSSWERFIWGPVALIQAVLCLVIARSRIEGAPAVLSESIPERGHAA